ncbi:tRNA (guanosine(37)-N1)-methyltransferase TrmD [Geothermobacter hydrogeniphilus]|uniref:tRNA (guanine-N(1)-)-methyltransferase n=1 Tax=Geothermobacter hydrogeniphilus TaxID=1969733 RepID=A0A2K2H5P2_9BACT|nr:tRNA (guanosine(37)-N1)-methyltransferase TrmD [Geothermobacter hydrogeniphilus]PNU18550.1 tRNA (guanosine(37)-N1)-methyltransferase TrmD [Geothermobacter hydrogeniphilus]
MTFDILTLFPQLCASPFSASILGKAQQRGLISVRSHNLRDWAEGRHQVTDDTPYGGGDGMVMKVDPVAGALADLQRANPGSRVLLMTPQGRRFCQAEAEKLAREPGLIFVCGRYEGIDERVRSLVDDEYSIGDFVMTGGELPAMTIIDAVARLLPDVLGAAGSAAGDSFSDGLLEYPQYTRPAEFNGQAVPPVLLSGDHGAIARWRRRQQLQRTFERRPELLETAPLDDQDREFLRQLRDDSRQTDG